MECSTHTMAAASLALAPYGACLAACCSCCCPLLVRVGFLACCCCSCTHAQAGWPCRLIKELPVAVSVGLYEHHLLCKARRKQRSNHGAGCRRQACSKATGLWLCPVGCLPHCPPRNLLLQTVYIQEASSEVHTRMHMCTQHKHTNTPATPDSGICWCAVLPARHVAASATTPQNPVSSKTLSPALRACL